MYAAGLVPTKAAAADAVGLARGTFYAVTAPAVADGKAKQLHTSIDAMVADDTVDTRKLIDLLARKAIGVVGNLMTGAEDEAVKLRAAQDLMDRGSETGKINKHQIESWSLSGRDAKGLAEAMVEAARVREQYRDLEHNDFIRIEGGLGNEHERDERQEAGDGSGTEGTKAVEQPVAEVGTRA